MTASQFGGRRGVLRTILCVFLVSACAATGAKPTTAGAPAAHSADEVRDVVVGVTHDIDAKRWPELRARFGDRVTTDYTSLFGGEPRTEPGDALIATWRGVLAKVATHHQLGPVQVRIAGERAFAECHVRGMHHAPTAASGSDWEVLGHYQFELRHNGGGVWRIEALTLVTHAQVGNTKLLAEAGAQ